MKIAVLGTGMVGNAIRKAHEAVHPPYDSITEVKRVTGADMRIQTCAKREL